MSRLKTIFDLLKETFTEWNEDKVPRLAAALAYYTAFSIAPLLIIVIAIAGLAFGQDAAQGEIVNTIRQEVGLEAAEVIETMLANTSNETTGIIATIIGVVTIILGAIGFFAQLEDALNTIWSVEPKPGQGIMKMIKDRLLSFTMVLGIGFLLLVSLLVSALLSSLNSFIEGLLPQAQLITQLINFAISFGVITLLFAMIYKVLPDVEITWRDVWVGAAITALLFTIGKFALGLYLGNSSVGSTYGAAGSFVVLLVWIYYSAQILLFGAEFTQVYARRYGSRIRPAEDAVWVEDEAPAKQAKQEEREVSPVPAPQLAAAVDAEQEPDVMIVQHRASEMPKPKMSALLVGLAVYNTVVAGVAVALSFRGNGHRSR